MNLLLIDGSALAHRAYYGTAHLHRSDGLPVGGVYGFCSILWSLLHTAPLKEPPTHALMIMDHPSRDTFRKAIWPDYKANRAIKSADLSFQLSTMKQASEAFGLPVVAVEGVEADDVIASYVRSTKEWAEIVCGPPPWPKVVIVSYDKDLMQLCNGWVRVYKPKERAYMGPWEVQEKFGVRPDQLGDFLALIGDAADNVPGVPGIGERKAADLLAIFGSLEAVICNAAQVKWPTVRGALIEHGQRARIARKLIELKCDVPLPISIHDIAVKAFEPKPLLNFCAAMEFRGLQAEVADRYGYRP